MHEGINKGVDSTVGIHGEKCGRSGELKEQMIQVTRSKITLTHLSQVKWKVTQSKCNDNDNKHTDDSFVVGIRLTKLI